MGLEGAGQLHDAFGIPVVVALSVPVAALGVVLAPGVGDALVSDGVGEVEPHHVDLAVVGEQLGDLVLHVLAVAIHVAAGVEDVAVGALAEGMEPVHGEIGVMPVNEGVIEADVEALGAEGVHHLAEGVFAVGGVGDLVVGVLGVPQAEALVVLGGEDHVAHAGLAGGLRPFAGLEEVGVEEVEVDLVVFVGDLLIVADPLVPRRHGVESPVDEHAKTVVGEPAGIPLELQIVSHCRNVRKVEG